MSNPAILVSPCVSPSVQLCPGKSQWLLLVANPRNVRRCYAVAAFGASDPPPGKLIDLPTGRKLFVAPQVLCRRRRFAANPRRAGRHGRPWTPVYNDDGRSQMVCIDATCNWVTLSDMWTVSIGNGDSSQKTWTRIATLFIFVWFQRWPNWNWRSTSLYINVVLSRCGHRGLPAPVTSHWIGLDRIAI